DGESVFAVHLARRGGEPEVAALVGDEPGRRRCRCRTRLLGFQLLAEDLHPPLQLGDLRVEIGGPAIGRLLRRGARSGDGEEKGSGKRDPLHGWFLGATSGWDWSARKRSVSSGGCPGRWKTAATWCRLAQARPRSGPST